MSRFEAFGFKKLHGVWFVFRKGLRDYNGGKKWAERNGMYRVLAIERTGDGRVYCKAHGRAPGQPWREMMWQMVVPNSLLVYTEDKTLTWRGTLAALEERTMGS